MKPSLADVGWALLLPLACLALVAGCAGYQIGAGTLYRPDIQTVHVPMFESDTLRRNLGELLTEAVVKEIELNTPYKVVDSAGADSVLSGRVVQVTKSVLAENADDDPRDLQIEFHAEVNWTDRRGNLIGQPSTIPLPSIIVNVRQPANFIPEAGQSMASAQHEAVRRLAKQIVGQMETPWW